MLTPYEQQRLDNINKNKAILKELKLDKYQDDNISIPQHNPVKVSKKRSTPVQVPSRKSTRSGGRPDDQTPSPTVPEPTDAKLKTFEEYFGPQVAAQAIHVTGFYQGKSPSPRLVSPWYYCKVQLSLECQRKLGKGIV